MIIKIGDTGSDVIAIQRALGITADGVFGPQTLAAVQAFQTKHHMLADGIVGPVTWAMLKLPPEVTPGAVGVQGLDVYEGSGLIDWMAVKASGRVFAFIKCTEGIDYHDSMYAANMKGARAAGLMVAPYHFFHPNDDAEIAATKFLQAMGYAQPGDLPPMFDWETHEGTPAHEIGQAMIWLQFVEAFLHKKPIIYTYAPYINELGNPPQIGGYPFWIAGYGSNPTIPAPFSGYTFWQYSDKGVVPGCPRHVDVDVAGGDLAWLTEFANTTT